MDIEQLQAVLVGLGICIFFSLMLYGKRWLVQKRLRRAAEALQAGQLDEAERLLRACIKGAPSAAVLHAMLAGVLVKADKLDEAEAALVNAVAFEPKNPSFRLQQAYFLAAHRPERPDEALDALEQAIAFQPNLRATLAQAPVLAGLRGQPRFKELMKP